MKKYIIITISFIFLTIASIAQTFEFRTLLDEHDYIAVQLRQTTLGSQPDPLSTADDINDMVFEIRWLQSLGDVDVDIICTNYYITESGLRTASGSYYFQDFSISTAFISPDDFVLNEWKTIATLQSTITSGSTSGAFDVAPDGWPTVTDVLIITIGWDGSASTEYTASEITGAANNTPIPTVVYDLVWTGATDAFWDKATNWETACGGTGSVPNTGNNCFIPSGLTTYPSDFFAASFTNQPTCDYLRISSGASLTLKDIDALSVQLTYTVNNDLTVYGTLTSIPNSQLTVTGSTYIDAANGLVVEATSAGIGSFIDNGTITYGTNGTAKVQTYITNGAIAGTFYIHTVGPAVD
ncbi:MAG: hypothetical protein L3J31_09365, partial [Bacteroidales bacterium]|nr:hypothetical protein [Bacteroidales bacterium]